MIEMINLHSLKPRLLLLYVQESFRYVGFPSKLLRFGKNKNLRGVLQNAPALESAKKMFFRELRLNENQLMGGKKVVVDQFYVHLKKPRR